MTFSTDHPLILDVSSHEGFMDIGKTAAHNPLVYGVLARATISWGYSDSHFQYFKKEVKEKSKIRQDAGGKPLFFGGYHVIYVTQPIQSQCDNFFRTAGEDIAVEWPAIIDAELDQGATIYTIAKALGDMISVFKVRTGRMPMIYSRASWLNEHVTNFGKYIPDWFDDVDFHLALYGGSGVEHAGPLTSNAAYGVPKGITDVRRLVLHQTSDTIPGTEYGCPNFEKIDTNRWQLTEQELLNYIGWQAPLPLTLETLENRVKILEREARLKGWNLA